MPMPTPEEFWKLADDTGLIDHDQVESLRREFGRDSLPPGTGPDAVTELLARWLVRRKVITIWQARRLARGDRGPFFVGDYRLLERLDTPGSKGILLRARHEPSGRRVCLMLLDAALCRQLEIWTDIVRRTSIAHQAVDPVTSRTWALEQAGAQRFIVCEDVVGGSLAEELAARGPLPIAEAGPLMVAIARAVAELHRLGAVHGSLSLDVLRREPSPNGGAGNPPTGSATPAGRVRLLQFPLVADPHVVPQRPPLDSPEAIQRLGMKACFVAPELLLPASGCDSRSDVYALGCLFHALLSGTPPCWQGDAQRSLSQAAFVGPPPLGPPRVPVEVATLISYMVARDPAARYATAAEAADAIALCLGMPAVSAALPPQRPFITSAAARQEPAPEAAAATESTLNPVPLVEATRLRAATQRRPRWMALAAVGALAVGAAAAAFFFLAPQAAKPPTPVEPPAAAELAAHEPPSEPVPNADADDDAVPEPSPAAIGRSKQTEQPVAVTTTVIESETLPWASPTQGSPPTLAYLPPGSQLILLARPADIMASDEGRQFVRALGPRVEQALQAVAVACGCEPEKIEMIQAGWQAGGPDEVVGGYAIRGVEPFPVADDPDLREQAWGKTEERDVKGETVHVGKSVSFWMPPQAAGQVLVIAPEKLLEETIDPDRQARETTRAGGADDAGHAAGWRERLEANLPPDLEDLVGMLDGTRHLTLFGAPTYLLHDGRPVFAGPLAKLIDPLGEFLGSDLQAAALSLHFGDSFYLELDSVAPARTPAPKLAKMLAEKTESLADVIEEYCNALDPHPYGRKLVMRLPRMLGIVAGGLRFGAEGRGAVVNCHLPEHAAHNLALAVELAIEQTPGVVAATAVASRPAGPQSSRDRVQKKMSLVFNRDTLEKSIQMVADEIGVPIEILGKDLELEGITKNQSFGLEERDQTADAVLRTILAKSNPDGKLVYVFRAKDGAESIEITTRAAAAKRGDTLPPGFESGPAAGTAPEKPEKKKK